MRLSKKKMRSIIKKEQLMLRQIIQILQSEIPDKLRKIEIVLLKGYRFESLKQLNVKDEKSFTITGLKQYKSLHSKQFLYAFADVPYSLRKNIELIHNGLDNGEEKGVK